jgi:predicted PurR-regulated permease PerM
MDETEARPTDPGEGSAPPWMSWLLRQLTIRGILVLVVAALSVLLLVGIFGKLQNVLGILFMAFFISFAIEPGVNWFAARGWRRGYATGLIFVIVFLVVIGLIVLIVPAVISGAKQLVDAAPELIDRGAKFANDLGWHVSGVDLTRQVQEHAQDLASSAANLAGSVLGVAASLLGSMFRWATIALFTFYIVAEGPKLRRVICSALPPQQQQHVLFIWDQAIEKTGGYFYSRLLLAVINGTGMYVTLRVFNVPFAAPLAVFVGIVSEFIPIVGTYIAGVPPLLVATLYSPTAGIAALAYILIYQQIENYFLSPRLTAKTMALHPAVAFGAALTGGALGGILAAFLALPVAGVIQAAVGAWGKRYDVVHDQLTEEPAPRNNDEPGVVDKLREAIDKDFGSDESADHDPDHGQDHGKSDGSDE